VAALLQAGCNPNLHNKKGVMPISAAAHKGDIQIMELLISKGALVDALNVSGSTALIQVFFLIYSLLNSLLRLPISAIFVQSFSF
jgi:ankyrin repeat protein